MLIDPIIILCIQTALKELNQLPLKLKWRRGKDTPFGVYGYPKAVVFKGKVFVGGGGSDSNVQMQTVMVLDPQLNSCETSPCANWLFSMTIVNNQLVVVGGKDAQSGKKTNKIGVWNNHSKTWTNPLPPMTTACSSPSVIVYNNRWLVIMGGFGDTMPLSRVEILDTTGSGQWYPAAPLPQPCFRALTAIIGNMCYLVGSYSTVGSLSSVCLDVLISQAVPQPAHC